MMTHNGRYFENTMNDKENTQQINEEQKNYVALLLRIIHEKYPPLPESQGAVYTGPAGVAYAFYHVAQSGSFDDAKDSLLKIAETYVKVNLHEMKRRDPAHKKGAFFLSGHAGVYAVASLIYEALGRFDLQKKNTHSFLNMQKFLKPGTDEFFVGHTGYLAACLMINKRLGREMIPNDVLLSLCNTVIESGRQSTKVSCCGSPLMYTHHEKLYIGAGHGLATILLMLLNFPACYSSKPDVEQDIKLSVDFILKCEESDGNYPSRPGHTREDKNKLIQWCHGAPGIIYLLTKAYIVWKEDKYKQAALRCGDVIWKKGLLKKGPGLCHGVGGNGYAFLLLYQLTHDEKHLRRALKFAAFMQTEEFKTQSDVPDSPYSLFEGFAGTACFLADLVNAELNGTFPFMDVF